jgi:hypothetical protein
LYIGTQGGGRTRLEAAVRIALQDDEFHHHLLAQLPFFEKVSLLVDNEDIGAELHKFFQEIEHPRILGDKGILDTRDRLDHIVSLLLGVAWGAPF